MRKYHFNLILVLFLFFPAITTAQIIEQITLTSIEPIVSSSGDEIVSDFTLSYSDGTSEIFSSRFGDSVFWYSGTSAVPSTWSLPLQVSVTYLGPGGPGPGVTNPQYILDPNDPRTIEKYEDQYIQPAPVVIYLGIAGGSATVSAAACAAGWFMARRSLRESCERRGGRVVSLEVGRCGIVGTSRVICEYPRPPVPPPRPGPSWGSYANGGGLPLSYLIDNYMLDLSVPGI